MSRVAVAGAGLTGSLLAVRLAQAGHEVTLYDRRPDLRVHDIDAGRSINLALSTRGIDALQHVGLEATVLDRAIEMPGRMIHDTDGETTFQPYGTEPHHRLHSVNRDELNIALLNAVDATEGIAVHFGHRVRDFHVRRRELVIEAAGRRWDEPFDVLFGADGAYSAVRGRLQRVGRVDFSQTFLAHGYKELTIPAGSDGGYAIDPHALHIWPRETHMMIALPNPDGTFTGTLFWPFDGRPGFNTVKTDDDVHTVFEREFPDAHQLIPDLADQYRTNPSSSLVTMRCGPWHYADEALVLGDAAHAVVPFLGQGANASLEDVTVLMALYDELGADRHADVFEEFSRTRKPDTDALADLAVEHYEEMRDAVASRWFLVSKWLERLLARIAPRSFVPLYTMISFTRTPYAEAVARAAHQQRIVRAVAIGIVAALIMLIVLLAALG